MIFYKNLFISVILSVLLVLIFMAVIMYNSKKKQVYPPVFQPCPDYYKTDSAGNCLINAGVWDSSKVPATSGSTSLSCSNVDFSGFKNPGIGASSSLCTKKKWAQDCQVTWDGITNNSAICYN